MSPIGRRGLLTGTAAVGLLGAAGAAVGSPRPKAPDRILSARDFGAVGDGVTDDTAALQKAFEATLTPKIATMVVIPPGLYRVTKTIRVVTKRPLGGNITHRTGILAHGARLVSVIDNGSPVIEIESQATLRFYLIEGLQINGSGKDGHGLLITCQKRGTYFYNFCLRDLVVEGCGGDGCRLIGNVFEGQIINGYFRENKGCGATFGHGKENTVLSAVHVFGCVFGANGVHGVTMIDGAQDVGFYGCYFLLNQRYGLSAATGCTLLSHCGFENNHMRAKDFDHGDAGLRLMVGGTLIGCTAYSIQNQTLLIRAFVTNRLVMIGCTASGGGAAKRARLGVVQGKGGAGVSVIGCQGGIERKGGIEMVEFDGEESGLRVGGRWDSEKLAWLGEHCLWVDSAGVLRIKKGKPKADDDGNAVGNTLNDRKT